MKSFAKKNEAPQEVKPLVDEIDVDKEYPLNDAWTLCYKGNTDYTKNQTASDWLKEFKKIYTIDTIQLFWKIYNNIPVWSSTSSGTIYSIFKDNILPSWEDPKNTDGFSLILYTNNKTMRDEQLDELYLNLLLFIIGNTSSFSFLINGCTFDRKYNGSKITLWLNSYVDEDMTSIVIDDILEKIDYYKYMLGKKPLISRKHVIHRDELNVSVNK